MAHSYSSANAIVIGVRVGIRVKIKIKVKVKIKNCIKVKGVYFLQLLGL